MDRAERRAGRMQEAKAEVVLPAFDEVQSKLGHPMTTQATYRVADHALQPSAAESAAPAAPPAPESDTNPWPLSSDHAIIRGTGALNDRRKLRGVGPLTIDAGLNRAAAESAKRVGSGL